MIIVGGTLAVLAERLYLFDLLGGGLEDSRSVTGGLIIAEQIGKLYVVGRKLAFETTLSTGQVGKVYEIINDERIDSCTTIRVTNRLSTGISKMDKTLDEELVLHNSTDKHSKSINPKDVFVDDDITSATMDNTGKKMYIGTHSGKILLLDTTTLGILNHLTFSEQDVFSRDTQGPVVKMKYCSQNELLVVAHSNGAIKVFSGCHRTISAEQREKYLAKKNYTEWCQYCLGGNTPSSPILIRSNQSVQESTVLAMAVSEELGLIAVSGSDGTGVFPTFVGHIWQYELLICIHCLFVASIQFPISLDSLSNVFILLFSQVPHFYLEQIVTPD